ncbi:MAG: cytochrome C oxidase subunit IV family protein [Planctomycetes bacterium]|nr:cytochrome C oxidase subunit IV family protein [Planctomycetota bacterium]
MSNQQSHAHKNPNYWMIWLYLLILTIVEVGIGYAYMIYKNSHPNVKVFGIVSLIFLASWKAGLVGAYFMHLKFEKKTLIAIVLTPFVLLVILALALLPDALK